MLETLSIYFSDYQANPWIASTVWHMPSMLSLGIKLFSPYVVNDWRPWYQMITRDISQATLESFFTSISSLHKTDLRSVLPAITKPILGIYGAGDNVVAPNQANLITETVPISRIKVMAGSKHFPMLDEPQAFNDFTWLNFSPLSLFH